MCYQQLLPCSGYCIVSTEQGVTVCVLLLQAVLNECLRLLPSAPLTSREALEDITVGGWFIPKGTVVHVDIYGIQRDPNHFPQPEEFRPERFFKVPAPMHLSMVWSGSEWQAILSSYWHC